MAGGIAHEINNPLAIIHGYARRILHDVQDNDLEKIAGDAQAIINMCSRVTGLTKGMLAMSRGQAQPKPFDMKEAVIKPICFAPYAKSCQC